MIRYDTTRLVLLAAAGLALETTALEVFSLRGSRVELLLLLACFAALFARDSRQGLLAAWMVGLFKDLGSGGPAGLHALLFLGAGWVVLRVRQVLFHTSPLTQLAVAFLATCWVQILSALFVSATAGAIPAGVIAGRTVLSALLTATCAPPVFAALARARGLVT